MAHIIIAGRPNSEDTSECILLAENLQAHFPTIRYIQVLKPADEWENYSEKVCNLFGFLRNTHPLIFYSNGSFIGNKEDFFKLIKSNFKLGVLNDESAKLQIETSVIKALTQEHIKITNEEYSIRVKGAKIRDRIEKKFDDISREDIDTNDNLTRYNTLDCVFAIDYLGDLQVHYKYNLKFQSQEKEFIEYPEPLEKAILEVSVERLISNQSIENTKEYMLTVNSRNMDEFNVSGAGNTSMKLDNENEIDHDSNKSMNSNKNQSKREVKFNYYKNFDAITYKFENKEKYLIESNFGLNYKLVINPFLSFYGEIILYQDESISDSAMTLNDYGRLPSLRKIIYDENLIPLIKLQHNLGILGKENVSYLESNIYPRGLISEEDIH